MTQHETHSIHTQNSNIRRLGCELHNWVTYQRCNSEHIPASVRCKGTDCQAKSEYAIKLESPCYGYRYEGYTYYNGPVDNYLGESPDDIREYVKQDYARMTAFNADDWQYIGIVARAEIVVGMVCQTIRSGGPWGIESDSDASYITDVEQEQLDELKDQLIALGFSRRAIATAMKSVIRITD